MRNLPRRGLVPGLLLVLVSIVGHFAAPAAAGTTTTRDGAPASSPSRTAGEDAVDVIEVSGLLDPVLVSFVERRIAAADRADVVAVVLRISSPGAVVDDGALLSLARAMRDAQVPVAVWIGPSGADAFGAAAEIAGVADQLGMAPGTRIGRIGDRRLPPDEFPLWGDDTALLADRAVGDRQAYTTGIATATRPVEGAGEGDVAPGAPTIGDFIVNLDGVRTRVIDDAGGEPRRAPVTIVRFNKLPLGDQLLHTVASPAVAYLLFVVGMALLIFELFTAGVGIAGMVGAVCFAGGCFGLAVLPTSPIAVALLVVSMVAFAVDVQTGVPFVWTGIGFVLFGVGTLLLYDGVGMSWVTIVAGLVGVALAFVVGMPSMVRTRFSTPTIGREWMVGEMGEAVEAVIPKGALDSPTGVVRIREALWRATTNRATPIHVGDRIRVVGIDRLVLEVEPESGGARDYRERGPRDS